jgi:DNA-binding NarL/FixJ family response regulator
MSEIAVAIVEDNAYVREAWAALVGGEEGLHLVGAYGSCEEALAADELDSAAVVLLDIGLPGKSGIEGIADLRKRRSDMIIIMCTVFEDDRSIFDALCAGAVGYVLKKTSPADIIRAIREAVGGGSPMSPAIARKVIQSFHVAHEHAPTPGVEPLTPREREILSRLVQGKSYPVIASELFISVDGVRYHLRHIYEKLHVSTRAEAVAKGLKDRLIPPPR